MAILEDLKAFNVTDATISLWVFKGPRGPVDAPPIYTAHWVDITAGVGTALKHTVIKELQGLEEILPYDLLAQNNESSALSIEKDVTNAGILTLAVAAETGPKKVLQQKQLLNSTFYLIKLVHEHSLLHAIRRVSNTWKTKRALSARSLFFH